MNSRNDQVIVNFVYKKKKRLLKMYLNLNYYGIKLIVNN